MDIAFHLSWSVPMVVLIVIGFACMCAIAAEQKQGEYDDGWELLRVLLYWWVPAFCIFIGHVLT